MHAGNLYRVSLPSFIIPYFPSVPLEVSRHRPHNFLIGSTIFSLVSGAYDRWVVFHSFVDVWNKPHTDVSNTFGETEYGGRVKVALSGDS